MSRPRFSKTYVLQFGAFHEDDGAFHENDENDEDNSDSHNRARLNRG